MPKTYFAQRLPDETIAGIETLAKRWGCKKAPVIARSIADSLNSGHGRQHGPRQPPAATRQAATRRGPLSHPAAQRQTLMRPPNKAVASVMKGFHFGLLTCGPITRRLVKKRTRRAIRRAAKL